MSARSCAGFANATAHGHGSTNEETSANTRDGWVVGVGVWAERGPAGTEPNPRPLGLGASPQTGTASNSYEMSG